ncbi:MULTISPECIES: head-tail adaptor protein [unclassified Streptomyces]|uniref:phage head completion protein n=1 Tax=unclassified Streptomyces TaxID=2593676 RepID=UPI0036698C82
MSRVGRLLNTRVEAWRASAVDDGGGGRQTVWAAVATYRARRSQPSARERTAAHQAGAELVETWYLPAGSDVRRGDELRPPGRVAVVYAVYEPSAPGTYLRADCTVRQPTTET